MANGFNSKYHIVLAESISEDRHLNETGNDYYDCDILTAFGEKNLGM